MPPAEPSQPNLPLRRVVVLAGGGSRRLGRDKLAADLGNRTVLGALLEDLRSAAPDAQVVLVGPPERSTPGGLVVQEDPPGGGPVAGLAAGLAAGRNAVAAAEAGTAAPADGPTTASADGPTTASADGPTAAPADGPTAAPADGSTEAPPDDDDLVAVLAGDQPFAAAALPLLVAALNVKTPSTTDLDGAVGVDPDGHDQPLLAVYRAGALQQALAELAAGSGLAGARVRDLVARLRVTRVPLPETAALDVDTAQDLERARAVVRRKGDDPRP
jgi:molybdopterin-guanine dinucleotide biosynthesis protein A